MSKKWTSFFAVLGLVQMDADGLFGQKSALRQESLKWAEHLRKRGAKLVVFPEGSSTGYVTNQNVWCRAEQGQRCENRHCQPVEPVAENVPSGVTTQAWLRWSSQSGVSVVFWIPEREGNHFYNTTVGVNPDGTWVRYRKRDLYKYDRCWADAGNASQVFDTPVGRFGLLTCLDASDRNGRYYAEYRAKKVQAVLISMDWDESAKGPRSARRMMEAKAQEVGLPLAVADQSAWDGTGVYLPDRKKRLREEGLSESAVGRSGGVLGGWNSPPGGP